MREGERSQSDRKLFVRLLFLLVGFFHYEVIEKKMEKSSHCRHTNCDIYNFKFTLHGERHSAKVLGAGTAVKPTLMVMIMTMDATTNTHIGGLALTFICKYTEPFKNSFISPRRLFDLRVKHFKIHGSRSFLFHSSPFIRRDIQTLLPVPLKFSFRFLLSILNCSI